MRWRYLEERIKVALYGLGTETEKAILQLETEYEVIGLLDSFKSTGEIFERKIISIQQAIDYKVKRIIVVARPGSCKAIVCKIGAICKKHNIKLYDIRGVDLLHQEKCILEIEKLLGIAEKSNYRNTYSDNVKFELFRKKINTLDLGNQKCVVSNAYDIGYLFFAPLITDFVLRTNSKYCSVISTIGMSKILNLFTSIKCNNRSNGPSKFSIFTGNAIIFPFLSCYAGAK